MSEQLTGRLHVAKPPRRIPEAIQLLRAHDVCHAQEQVGHGLRAVLDAAAGRQSAAAAAREDERQVRVRVTVAIGITAAVENH